MLEQVEWGEFKLGDTDVFEIGTGSLVDIKSAKPGKIPRVSVQTTDNGIIGYYYESLQNARYFENFISINFFGIAYYHPYYASVEMKVHTIKLKNHNLSKAEGLFISSMLNRLFKGKYSYGTQLSSSKLKTENFKISLPLKNGKIDFEFMDKFIAELEAEHQAELEAYLETTGLKNHELTSDELKVLKEFEEGKIEWKNFNLEDLFGKSTRGKRLKSDDRIPGNLPFVTAGEADEGISAFIGNDVTVFSKNTTTIDMFGSAKYRNYEYGGDDHVAIVHTELLPKYASIFITTAIHKSSHNGQFDYGKNFYAKDADELNIKLPIKDGKPDYEFMETFISAIHKLVIKDVVIYNQEKLKATAEVINK